MSTTPSLIIKTIVVSPFQQNARVILNPETKRATIVDPGDNIPELVDACDGYDINQIFITHSHIDHVGGLQDLLDLLASQGQKPSVFARSEGAPIRQYIEAQAKMYGFPEGTFKNAPAPTDLLDECETVHIDNFPVKVLFTPGHAPGHVCFLFENVSVRFEHEIGLNSHSGHTLIAGDALFRESIGRTDLPLCNHDQLITSIKNELFTLPDETIVLPGHGPHTTIGHEKQHNPFV